MKHESKKRHWYNIRKPNAYLEHSETFRRDFQTVNCLPNFFWGGGVLTWGRRVPASALPTWGSMPQVGNT